MESKQLSVLQLNEYIKNVFDDELILHDIVVYGEISEANVAGGNSFVTLREGNSVLHCVHFGTLPHLQVGQKVKLFGSVRYSVKSGKLNFVFSDCRPFGKGELYEDFLRRKALLEQEGLFDNRPTIPACIRNIAIITSETGAVIHDFVYTVHRYHTFGKIHIFPVRVQGNGAAEEIADAVRLVNTCGKPYDVLVVARGGGANDELDTFNNEQLARAVAGSKIPVISAVGHETDFTLCDFCASWRAGTPSIAGEFIANRNAAMLQRYSQAAKALTAAAQTLLTHKQQYLRLLVQRVMQNANLKISLASQRVRFLTRDLTDAADTVVRQKRKELAETVCKLETSAVCLLQTKQDALGRLETQLDKNSPLRILSQGYAKLYKGRQAIDSVRIVKPQDAFRIILQDGKIEAVAKTVSFDDKH